MAVVTVSQGRFWRGMEFKRSFVGSSGPEMARFRWRGKRSQPTNVLRRLRSGRVSLRPMMVSSVCRRALPS